MYIHSRWYVSSDIDLVYTTVGYARLISLLVYTIIGYTSSEIDLLYTTVGYTKNAIDLGCTTIGNIGFTALSAGSIGIESHVEDRYRMKI